MKTLTLQTKTTMNHLLLKDSFDLFLLIEGEVTTFNTFSFNGRLKKEYLDELPKEEYSKWKALKGYCLSLIKGKKTPLNFRFIFTLSKKEIANFLIEYELSYDPSEVIGLYLNFHYENGQLNCTTGTSLKSFSLDKSIDHAWDHRALDYFYQLDIPFDIL
ncbi:hypothetical protein M2454_002039 [Aequitasia blattaphilus]|uniref:DUF5721 family protein n=1 Tax=Aequitasia blattaphilus TaxID=2949332 RepID=A0ABT1EA58_9FIRM|nr:DUF5721 family protein [Aequitasia blattaphilus]MCP1102725.1 DUF5721 family protein [Aequitasia blattaphilus]MCR8615365.1 DUF5721 family protein [Aequitasia blattaphilus]